MLILILIMSLNVTYCILTLLRILLSARNKSGRSLAEVWQFSQDPFMCDLCRSIAFGAPQEREVWQSGKFGTPFCILNCLSRVLEPPFLVHYVSSPLRLIIAFGVVTNSCVSKSQDIVGHTRTFFGQIITFIYGGRFIIVRRNNGNDDKL